VEELGEEKWTKEIAELNEQAPVILRTNTLKTTKRDLRNQLQEEDIDAKYIQGYPLALELEERANVFKTKAFKDGWFEVQDASSQLVSDFLDVQPGMRIVDTCAGAGGKSLQLAAIMENKGQIIALDIFSNKLKELKRRAKRAGAHNIETRLIDNNKVIKKLHNSADRVLIDAPCSGLGVLSRNPDAKWKLQPEFIKTIQETQADLLDRYSKIMKDDGKMVYATCSILPSENQKQVQAFLQREAGKDFKLVKEKIVLANESGYDGFYMAQLEKSK